MTIYAEYAIPFHGFYESMYDYRANDELDCLCEEYGVEFDDLHSLVDWEKHHLYIAKEYAKGFFEKVGIGGEFVELVSPKFYNFETDRIFVKSSLEDLFTFRDKILCDEATIGNFREYVREHYTSRDGFISFVDTNVNNWNWRDQLGAWAILFEFYDANYAEYEGWSDYSLVDDINEYLCENTDVLFVDISEDDVIRLKELK